MSSLVSHDLKWLFIHPPRTGGTSVSWTLLDLFKQKHGEKHSRLWEFDLDPAEYFKFMTVRNPWARCASLVGWYAANGERHSIERAIGFALPLEYYGLREMDSVLRCEHMDRDFAGLCAQLGIEPRPLRRLNQRDHRPYQEYFTDELRRVVAERFAYEIERFRYTF